MIKIDPTKDFEIKPCSGNGYIVDQRYRDEEDNYRSVSYAFTDGADLVAFLRELLEVEA